jgi:hypothetical protein
MVGPKITTILCPFYKLAKEYDVWVLLKLGCWYLDSVLEVHLVGRKEESSWWKSKIPTLQHPSCRRTHDVSIGWQNLAVCFGLLKRNWPISLRKRKLVEVHKMEVRAEVVYEFEKRL